MISSFSTSNFISKAVTVSAAMSRNIGISFFGLMKFLLIFAKSRLFQLLNNIKGNKNILSRKNAK